MRDRPLRALARRASRAAARRRGAAARRPADRPQRGRVARDAHRSSPSPRVTAPRSPRSARSAGAGSPPTPPPTARCSGAPTRALTAAPSRSPATSTCSRSTWRRTRPRVAEEALALLSARPCPSGRTTLVLGDEQLALQIHESIGHALELDRILLGEASYAGTSWVAAARHRHPALRLAAAARSAPTPRSRAASAPSAGTTRASPAQRTMLIEDGVLRATLSDRQSAAHDRHARSGGAARADGFARQPIVRMTNVSIEPGEGGTLEELIADVRRGHLHGDATARGRSTTAACTSSSAPRSAARSATASSGGSCATRPTPASRRSSGARSTPSPAPRRGGCGGC